MDKKYLDLITKFDCEGLTNKEMIDLFSYLVRNGHIYNMQGHFQREMSSLIEYGYMDYEGKPLVTINEYDEIIFL